MPGIDPLLGAEFLAATGGDMTWFATADRLAGFAGLARRLALPLRVRSPDRPAAWSDSHTTG